ncbi:MAG: hypothetical protein IPI10_09130 [Bacteroidetes bacterium]|nr:hypothetical protein [Bacteroidota bacterium]
MKAIKILLKVVAIAVVGFFALATLVSLFYSKEIKQLIIGELNKNLATEIKVREFSFSVIRHFPFASIDMQDVLINDVNDSAKKDTLIYANRLALLFNVTGIFNKDVTVRKIIFDKGNLNIRIDEDGEGNYKFWKTTNDTAKNGVIDLQKILLKDVDITYNDLKNSQHYNAFAHKAQLSGRFSNDEFTLTTSANLFVSKLLVKNINYINQKEVEISSNLKVNTKTDLYKLENSSVKIADVKFDINGTVKAPSHSVFLDLDVKSNEADLASFISLLPPNYSSRMKSFKSKGRFVFHSTIKGESAGEKTPDVKVDFAISDGTLKPENNEIELTAINFSGNFHNSSSTGKSVLVIPSLAASLSGHKIKAEIRIDDLDNAFLTIHASTQLDLAQVKPFITADTLEQLSGNLAMNVYYSGKLSQLQNMSKDRLYEVKASGNIDISHVNFKLKNNPLAFLNMSGNFVLKNEDVAIENLSGKISSTDFKLDGVFKNFIPFILVRDQPGDFIADVVSNNLAMDELLVNKSAASSPNDTSYIMKFNPRLTCDLNVSIGNMQFRKFQASGVRGQIHLERQIISSRGLNFKAMDGVVQMDANINASRRDSIVMSCDAHFAKLDITRLFYEMENFDQTTMTDKNVKGRISADVQFASIWSKDLTINSSKVISTCDITIENGELNNFTPILALAKYIKVPDLNKIKFSTLTNRIAIKDRKIFIPNMEIKSSAINISGNGTHSFDNIVDYHLKLLLSDVLGKKMKSNSTEFGEIEDDGLGRPMLMLSMKGPVDNPKFAYDHKAAGEKIKTEINKERQTLKELFKEEFSPGKKDSVKTSKPKKKDEMQIDWDSEQD